MVDRTTLPNIREGETLTEGQRFTIIGSGFNSWPNEIVLSYNDITALDVEFGGQYLMRLVGKTNNSLVFEVVMTYTYGAEHIWNVFATPNDKPRRLLIYE